MALAAEHVVAEWMFRQGFMTVRGARLGNTELDLLGVRPKDGGVEGWHVEVQVSFRPVDHLGPKLKEKEKSAISQDLSQPDAKRAVITSRAEKFVEKKFTSENVNKLRDSCWPGIEWRRLFVHGRLVAHQLELEVVQRHIETISFEDILDHLLKRDPKEERVSASATDIAEIVAFYEERVRSTPAAAKPV